MSGRTVFLLLMIAGLLCSVDGAFAQSEYDEKALRLQVGFTGAKVVAGADANEVARIGMFPTRDVAPLLRERSAEAADLYLDFRSKQIQGNILIWSGLALVIAGLAVGQDNEGAALGFAIGGLAVGFYGASRSVGASDLFHRSIWEYNRTFAAE